MNTELEDVKAEMYETLAVINRAFQQIIRAVARLAEMGVLSEDYAQDQDTLTNDLWTRINSQILTRVNEREADDRSHYGKMRATIERRIRGRQ